PDQEREYRDQRPERPADAGGQRYQAAAPTQPLLQVGAYELEQLADERQRADQPQLEVASAEQQRKAGQECARGYAHMDIGERALDDREPQAALDRTGGERSAWWSIRASAPSALARACQDIHNCVSLRKIRMNW